MMLDVLFKIKDDMDPTLAFRRSCRYALLPRLTLRVPHRDCAIQYSLSQRLFPQRVYSAALPNAGRESVGHVL